MSPGSLIKLLKQTPVFVPAAYALLASLWIFFSDRVLASLVSDTQRLTELQTYKGWLFVAITTVLLGVLIYWRQRALNEMNATLEQRVIQRTEALTQANRELAAAMNNLRRMQGELVRSEKVAALANLVAGVAHELNTPIGNSVLVATSFAENSAKLAADMAAGGIKKSVLENYVREATAAAALLTRNLGKASALVASFKQVAVDHNGLQRRQFRLHEVVNEILVTVRPAFNGLPITISSAVPCELILDSYPGPLGRVLGDLIDNAVVHGLDGRDEGGRVDVAARPSGDDEIELIVSDNGRGIPPADLSRIFDPFFSTRFGQGRSGLGLHIAHQLVTDVLGGRIEVRSGADTQAGVGAEFVLRLPRQPAVDTPAAV